MKAILFSINMSMFLFNLFQDILENDDIKLDWMFKCSLVTDLANVSSIPDNSVSWGNVDPTSSGRQYRRWGNVGPTYIDVWDLHMHK